MNMKKLFLLNFPYLLFVYPFDKLAQAFRLAPGADLSGKLLSIGDGFTAALSSPWLSFHPTDLLIGIAGAVILRMAVYLKGKNAKKYRHGIEYGSARWGTAADIAPYMDKDFFQNIPMTQTERITMASRPKQPKYARNKNIALGREELLKRVWGEDYLGECDTFAGGKKSAHSVGLLNNNQSVNW